MMKYVIIYAQADAFMEGLSIKGRTMDGIILGLSRFLATGTLNGLILIIAVMETVFIIQAYPKLKSLKERINKLNGISSVKKVLRGKDDRKLETETIVTSLKDWSEFDAFCDDYQNDSVLFSRISLIIQVFPLLGILGTVTGLFIAMNANADWSNAAFLFEGVRFALSSTVLGILFAVLFKFVDIFFSARFLGYIDDGIDRFRENYRIEKELPLGGERE